MSSVFQQQMTKSETKNKVFLCCFFSTNITKSTHKDRFVAYIDAGEETDARFGRYRDGRLHKISY